LKIDFVDITNFVGFVVGFVDFAVDFVDFIGFVAASFVPSIIIVTNVDVAIVGFAADFVAVVIAIIIFVVLIGIIVAVLASFAIASIRIIVAIKPARHYCFIPNFIDFIASH